MGDKIERSCKAKILLYVIALCFVIVATVMNVGLFTANRIIANKEQRQRMQIAVRDQNVNQFVKNLNKCKTMAEVHKVLGKK